MIYDVGLAMIWNVMRALCGSQWLPLEVQFTRSRPADIRPYRSFLRAPLRFDCESAVVVFDRAWLDVPLQSADAPRLCSLTAQALAIEAQATGDLPAQVRRMLRRQLLAGHTSMHDVATELGMHRRTLDRKLNAHAIRFQALLDEVRYEVARQLLSDTTMPMITIAHSLQFADASAFTRAFRRWAGMPPTRWRVATGAAVSPRAL